jgi:hypothetical protein
MATNLGAIEDLGDQKVKIEQYKQSLTAIIERQDDSEIIGFVDHSEHDQQFVIREIFIRCTCSLSLWLTRGHPELAVQHLPHPISSLFMAFFRSIEVEERYRLATHAAVLSDSVGLVVSRQLLQLFAQKLSSLPPATQKPIAQQYGTSPHLLPTPEHTGLTRYTVYGTHKRVWGASKDRRNPITGQAGRSVRGSVSQRHRHSNESSSALKTEPLLPADLRVRIAPLFCPS